MRSARFQISDDDHHRTPKYIFHLERSVVRPQSDALFTPHSPVVRSRLDTAAMITVEFSGNFLLSKSGLTRFLNRARVAVGLVGEVDVLLTDDATLKRLNRQYRGKNKVTDVLSFPAAYNEFAGDEQTAGDLAISLETAARQATVYGHGLRDEVRILLLHGLLHLHRLDHEVDQGQMAAREAELRAELRLPNGLIERVAAPSSTRRLRP